MTAILAPLCPGCGGPPKFVVGDQQAFCADGDCHVLCWDRYDDPARFKASAVRVDLTELEAVLPEGVEINEEREP